MSWEPQNGFDFADEVVIKDVVVQVVCKYCDVENTLRLDPKELHATMCCFKCGSYLNVELHLNKQAHG